MFDDKPVDQPGQQVTFKVGEREYDVASAATKIAHADSHISTLEQELKTLRDQLSLTEAQKKAFESLANNQPTPAPAQTAPTPSVDVDSLLAQAEERVFKALSKQQQDAAAKINLEASTNAARAVFGDTYQQALLERGQALGMSKDDIMAFAATKPDAFKQLFNLNTAEPRGQVPPASTHYRAPNASDDPIKQAARALLDRNSSSRQRTEHIAALLKAATR